VEGPLVTESIKIVVLGKAASYQKAVMNWRSKDGRSGTHAYDKKSYADWRSYARGQAADQYAGRPIIEGAVEIVVAIYREIPKGFSQKKVRLALTGTLRPLARPDVSNILKSVEDSCLTGIVIRDDSRIVSATVEKWYSDRPRVEIQVKELVPEMSLFAPVSA